jgi:hypothetical protein
MNLQEIAILRLASQRITGPGFQTAKDTVNWMGALQAQDYAMAKWAVGVRLAAATHETVEAAINAGEILRTHLLRPTWHLVSAENIYWLLELTAPQIKAVLKTRHTGLEISDTVVAKSNKIIENALKSETPLTREDLIAELERAGFTIEDNRGYHLLLFAELDGILCSGETINGKQTCALLENRVPRTKSLNREEALSKLANLYFSSRAPATVQDFAWWSRLSTGDAKRALEMAKPGLNSDIVEGQTYWFPKSLSAPAIDPDEVHLLPAFDEFIISYKDRTASLPFENFNKAVSSNGIFRPVIVVNGQVIGIWKRTINKDAVIVETQFFKHPGDLLLSRLEEAVENYGGFLQKKTELIHIS